MSTFNPFTSDDEVLEIGRGLIDRTLPKSAWTHAAHFASAIWLLTNYGDSFAVRALPGFIRAYNEATGVANTDTSGYHDHSPGLDPCSRRFFGGKSSTSPVCDLQRIAGLSTRQIGVAFAYWSRPRFSRSRLAVHGLILTCSYFRSDAWRGLPIVRLRLCMRSRIVLWCF